MVMCALRAADRFYPSAGMFHDTRDLHVAVTVSDRAAWTALADPLRRAVAQLSSDRLHFVPIRSVDRVRRHGEDGAVDGITAYRPDCVCLFSGGADSLAGVAHLLHASRRPLLVSQSVGPISGRQQELFDRLRERFPQLAPSALIQIRAYPNAPAPGDRRRRVWRQRDDLQRLRSMFFLSLAAQIAAAYKADDIFLCENGLIAAAIAFSPNQLSPYTTRPAEPHYLRQAEAFFRSALARPSLRIRNPFQYLTKGEMLAEAAALGVGDLLYRTVSCWRSGNRGVRNCGECVPCLFRQLAFDEASLPQLRSDYYGHAIPRLRWRRWRSDHRDRLIAIHEYCRMVQRGGRAWLFSNEPAVTDAIDVTGGPSSGPPIDPAARAALDEAASEHMAETIQRFARAALRRLE
jgi:7-cyano-7-deazaguanine synthase in queuosine biosynthesis